jgi:predicted glycosyltransferase involved in capsule biosynthesis
MQAWRALGLPGYSRRQVLSNALILRPLRRILLSLLCRAQDRYQANHLTVVIPVRNRFDERLENLFATLKNQTAWKQMAVLIVDYGSEAASAEKLRAFSAKNGIRYHRVEASEWNRSRALNAGLAQVRTKYILVSDVDLLFDAHYVEQALSLLQKKRLALAVAPMRDLPKGYPFSGKLLFSETCALAPARFARAFHPSILVGRVAFFRYLGGYEEFYRLWGVEDDDMLTRLTALGLSCENLGDKTGYFHQWHEKLEGVADANIKHVISHNRAFFDKRDYLLSRKASNG